jgi:hypothetical protein
MTIPTPEEYAQRAQKVKDAYDKAISENLDGLSAALKIFVVEMVDGAESDYFQVQRNYTHIIENLGRL